MNNSKKELLRTIKFALFSASAALIQIGSYTLFNEVIKLAPWQSHIFSLILSVLWHFTLNRKFTFHSSNNVPIAMLKVAVYYILFTPLSAWWTAVLAQPAGPINPYVVEICTMLINFVSEYLYQRFFVFGKSIDTAKK